MYEKWSYDNNHWYVFMEKVTPYQAMEAIQEYYRIKSNQEEKENGKSEVYHVYNDIVCKLYL
jgi:hypothetical protein